MTIPSDVVIVGAGAAGMMCAATAASRGHKVILLEQAKQAGRKILMSGGGRCNFTNRHVEADHFISRNPHFAKSALSRYTERDFIDLVERHQVAFHERMHGQLFCNDSARPIVDLLLHECAIAGVDLRLNAKLLAIEKREGVFHLETTRGVFACNKVVIATGGLSIPSMGCDGLGYKIARQFDPPVLPTRAGLVPFTFADRHRPVMAELSGVSLDISAQASGPVFNEAMLFTHRGLSGPAILQISNYWHEGENIKVDLLPHLDLAELLLKAKKSRPKIKIRTLLSDLVPRKLAIEFEKLMWSTMADRSLADIANADLNAIAQTLHEWTLKPSGTEGYRTAEVTLGGVDTSAISSKTFEAKNQAGLYFIGEVLDVTGWLGGFNFQWAWSSGYACGDSL